MSRSINLSWCLLLFVSPAFAESNHGNSQKKRFESAQSRLASLDSQLRQMSPELQRESKELEAWNRRLDEEERSIRSFGEGFKQRTAQVDVVKKLRKRFRREIAKLKRQISEDDEYIDYIIVQEKMRAAMARQQGRRYTPDFSAANRRIRKRKARTELLRKLRATDGQTTRSDQEVRNFVRQYAARGRQMVHDPGVKVEKYRRRARAYTQERNRYVAILNEANELRHRLSSNAAPETGSGRGPRIGFDANRPGKPGR